MGTDPWMAPAPSSPFNLVLWHQGYYKTEWWKDYTDVDSFNSYLGNILTFATYLNSLHPTTFMLSLLNIPNINPLFISSLANTLNQATAQGLAIGINVQGYAYNTVSDPPVLADLASLVSQLRATSYILTADTEGFTPELNAKSLPDFMTIFQGHLKTNGVHPLPTSIGISGGNAYKPTWSAPLVNIYEVYSQHSWNSIISKKPLNDVASTFNDLYGANAFAPIISGRGVPGWYSFSIECLTTGCDCIASEHDTQATGKNVCGAADVFGGWDLSDFLLFLHTVAEKLFSGQTPTFVIYQGAFVPESWLEKARGYELVHEPFLGDSLEFLYGIND